MMRLFICSILLCLGLMAAPANAQPDMACDGRWSVDFIKDKNYTPWHSYAGNPVYPASLKIHASSPKAVSFTDNGGRACNTGYIADVENDWVVFKQCGISEDPAAIPTHFKIRCKGDVLTGKIVTHKDGFKLKGTRVKD